MILIRGVAGTGKSTLAKSMGILHLESDMFFMQGGKYNFDSDVLQTAHTNCIAFCKQAIQAKCDVVVSNVFPAVKHMEPYIKYAEKHDYEIEVIRMTKEYGSVHNVPEEHMENMRKYFQDYDGEILK